MVKIELGGGRFARGNGWVNVDQIESADVIADLEKLPWPLPDEHADEIYSSHCIEHVENPQAFLDECARIGKIGCAVEIRCPSPHADMAMISGHKHVFSPQQAENMERHFPRLNWLFPKRLRLLGYVYQSTERLEQAKKDLPFLAGLTDQVIMKYIAGTAHEIVYRYVVTANEFFESNA